MRPRSRSRPLLGIFVVCVLVSAAGCDGTKARKASHLERGETFLAAGNFQKARIEFLNALQIDPKDSHVRSRMGFVEENLGKPRQAAQLYQDALDASPGNDDARFRLARLYLLAGNPERTLELIKPALEKHPDDAGLLTLRAAVRIQQKDVSGALADAGRAVALAPANEDAIAALAGIYFSQNEKSEAQALLEQSIQRLPGTIDLRLVLAQLYQQNDHPAEAEALLRKVIDLRPLEKAHRTRLALFYAESKQFDAAERTLRQAIKDLPAESTLKVALVNFLAAHRSRGQAELELNGMIAGAPAEDELKFALAQFYAEGKDPKQAEAVYQGIVGERKLEAAGLRARDQLAALRLQGGDRRGALALANEVLATSPRDEEALVLRGNIALANRDPRTAIRDLRAALRDRATDPGVLKTLALAHFANGEPDSAEESMRLAVETNPQNQALRLDLARLLADVGKPEQAQTILLDLVKRTPDNLDVLDLEFRVGSKAEDYSAAKAAADAIVALRPKLALGYFYQGMIAEARDRGDEALRLYHTAGEIQPDAAEPLAAEVRLLVAQKRTPDALKRLDAAAALNPKNAVAANLKGSLLMSEGHNAAAQEAFKQAIARAPTWWPPYSGLANAQLAAKQDPNIAVATLRSAKTAVDRKDAAGGQLADLLERLGRPDEAIAEYEELVRSHPEVELAANNLAMLLVTHRRDQASLDRAKELVQRFAESRNAAFLDTYGWVLYKYGDPGASVPALLRVVAKLPDQSFARYHLGMALALAGKNAEARENLSRAVNSGQPFAGLDEAKATLDKLAKLPDASAAPKT
jgi:tetratricopeptide (TPR) repeat protein